MRSVLTRGIPLFSFAVIFQFAQKLSVSQVVPGAGGKSGQCRAPHNLDSSAQWRVLSIIISVMFQFFPLVITMLLMPCPSCFTFTYHLLWFFFVSFVLQVSAASLSPSFCSPRGPRSLASELPLLTLSSSFPPPLPHPILLLLISESVCKQPLSQHSKSSCWLSQMNLSLSLGYERSSRVPGEGVNDWD